ncbi:acyl-CoA thioesterase [Lacinutrix undariae]
MKNNLKSDEVEIRVRYGETDQMGVVYHGNYIPYIEIGRTEWLRKLGTSYKEMEENGVMLPVVAINLRYRKSAVYDEVIKIETILKKIPTASIEFEFIISNSKGEVLTTGNSILAFIDAKTNRPMRCPKYILEKLEN